VWEGRRSWLSQAENKDLASIPKPGYILRGTTTTPGAVHDTVTISTQALSSRKRQVGISVIESQV